MKPDAPEFVPLSLSPAKPTTKEAIKAQKKLEKEEKKAASLSKKTGKKARFDDQGRR